MIVLFLGKKGVGKTAAERKLIFRRLVERPRSIVFWNDPACQIRGGSVFTSVAQAREQIRARGAPRLSIFRGVDVEELAQLACDVHDVTLVVDEMDRACQGKRWTSEAVRHLVHEGRHERVDLFGTFRRTANISEDLMAQADYIFLFRHSEANPYDLRTVRDRFGERYENAVKTLEPGRFVVWADE